MIPCFEDTNACISTDLCILFYSSVSNYVGLYAYNPT